MAIGGSLGGLFSWHETRFDCFYIMKKIIGACLGLVFAVLLGLSLADKSLAIGPAPAPPGPTNAAPASISAL